MRLVARFDDEFEQGRFRRQVGEGALMRDFDDVGAGFAKQVRYDGELAGAIDDVDRKAASADPRGHA